MGTLSMSFERCRNRGYVHIKVVVRDWNPARGILPGLAAAGNEIYDAKGCFLTDFPALRLICDS
jgi:hypothetical protein